MSTRASEPLVLKRLPTAAIPCNGADALAQKFASRVEWMRLQGIGIDLEKPKRLANDSGCFNGGPRRPVDQSVVTRSN